MIPVAVKIDNGLHEAIVRFINSDSNHLRFPSIKSFVDQAIVEKLERMKKKH